ncbi:aminoglycoside phosphotransferase family protein [Patescibacteria group bacterium]|nr:aminoglycoside phosphotransferase family protein [Patescibacteria group bacterium]
MNNSTLIINGEEYTFVKVRSHMPISIYKGTDTYLRIGPKNLIEQEINYHKNLLKFGFPIPEILHEGTYEDLCYFTESSFGDEHLGQIFGSNAINSIVSDDDFSKLLNVVKIFAQAQIKTIGTQAFIFKDFKELIKLDVLLEELPLLGKDTLKALEKVEDRITQLPSALTHGDFNPYNIFEKGVIDWERGSYSPLGYDLVTNISQTFFFPLGGDYEYSARYRYSSKQVEEYWQAIDEVCTEAGIHSISEYRNDFIFCRSVWSAVRMHQWPKIQEWRYRQYEALLGIYLNDGDLTYFLSDYKA